MKTYATVELNPLQFETYNELTRLAVNGIVDHAVVVQFKQNIIGALTRRGLLKSYRTKHLRFTVVPVKLMAERTKRTPKPVAVVRQIEMSAEPQGVSGGAAA